MSRNGWFLLYGFSVVGWGVGTFIAGWSHYRTIWGGIALVLGFASLIISRESIRRLLEGGQERKP